MAYGGNVQIWVWWSTTVAGNNNLVLMEPAPLGSINLKVIHDPEDVG